VDFIVRWQQLPSDTTMKSHCSLRFGLLLLFTACSFVASSPPPAFAAEREDAPREKKASLGADLGYLVPVGAFAKFAGPSIGPLVRGGYRVTPRLELTLRTGFLLGLSAGSGLRTPFGFEGAARTSTVPVWAGARLFVMDPNEGLYVSAESGLNIMLPESKEMRLRWGANGGVGFVFDKSIPVDLRAQVAVMNLLEDMPRDAGLERTYVALAMSLGYTF